MNDSEDVNAANIENEKKLNELDEEVLLRIEQEAGSIKPNQTAALINISKVFRTE